MNGVRLTFNRSVMDRLLSGPDGEVAKDLAKRAVLVERTAKHLAPVRTGLLRSSITWRLDKDSRGLLAIIGSNVKYAPYLELGTIHMSARPYLRPALRDAR